MAGANLTINLKQYFRAAITGSSYEKVDPREVGEWTEKEADAIKDATLLFVPHGTSKNYYLQRRIMLVEQAAAENSKRQAIADELVQA